MSYQWWRFLHIAGAFIFLLSHGVSVGAALRLRRERDRVRMAALLELSVHSVSWTYVGLLILIAAGVVLGFTTNAWGRGWIWTAIGVLLASMVFMYIVAAPYYRRLRNAVNARRGDHYLISDAEMEETLASSRPLVLAAGGGIALLVILWLMVFRPF